MASMTAFVTSETDEALATVRGGELDIRFFGGNELRMSVLKWRELNAAIERAIAAYEAAMAYAPDEGGE